MRFYKWVTSSLRNLVLFRNVTLGISVILLLGFQIAFIYNNELARLQNEFHRKSSVHISSLGKEMISIEKEVERLSHYVLKFERYGIQNKPNLQSERFQQFVSGSPLVFNSYFALETQLASRWFNKKAYVHINFKDNSGEIQDMIIDSPEYLTDPKEIWYQLPRQKPEVINYTAPYYDQTYTKSYMFTISKAIVDSGGTFSGVVGADLSVETIRSYFAGVHIGETGGALLLGPNQKPIREALSGEDGIFSARDNGPLHEGPKLKLLEDVIQEFKGEDGNTYLVQTEPLLSSPYSVVIYQQKSEAYRPMVKLMALATGVSFLVFVLMFLVVRFTGAVVVNTINKVRGAITVNSAMASTGQADKLRPIQIEAPKELAAVINSINIYQTELIKNIDKMNQSKERAETALASKSRFLSTMSHEIRTPLNGILGAVQLLKESPLNEEQTELVRLFQSSGDSLLRIVNDILDFSKIDSGNLKLESRIFNPLEIVRQCFALFSATALQRGISYRFDHTNLDPNLSLMGDELRYRQVLLNLIGNAIKFTEKGAVTLIADSAINNEGKCEVRISVSDTGIGMNEQQMGNLFKEFSQADETITRRFGGTGLGLTITKRIIDLMGGGLQIASREGVGSTFTVSISFEKIEISRPSQEFAHIQTPAVDSDFKGLSALIVDDMPANHTVLRAFLRKLGLDNIVSKENGEDGFSAIINHTFDVVFLDIQMPGLSGYDVLEKLKESKNRTPIFVVSANSFAEDREKSIELGAIDHISKPFKKDQIANCLRHIKKGKKVA